MDTVDKMRDHGRVIDRFFEEVAAAMTLKGRAASMGQDIGRGTVREFVEGCVCNGIRIEIQVAPGIRKICVGQTEGTPVGKMIFER